MQVLYCGVDDLEESTLTRAVFNAYDSYDLYDLSPVGVSKLSVQRRR